MRTRLLVMGGVLGVLAILPLTKLVGVQLRDGSELVAKGEDQRVRSVELPAQRGSILDRNGVELAISIPRLRVVTNMSALRDEGIEDRADLEQLADELAPLLGVDSAELARTLTGAEPDDPWVRLAETVPEQQARDAVAHLEDMGIERVLTLESSTERVHPAGDSALRLIGNLGPDGPGELAGIEKAYDEDLTGRDGKKVVELGTEGETIAGAERMVREPVSGSDVQLTLDRTLQHEVERIVAEGTAAAGGVRGIAIIGRPSTGEILAAGSVERDEETGRMRLSDAPIAVSNAYQAGSVFKLVTVAAAVEAGQVGPDTRIEVPWRIVVDDRTFSDHEEHPTEMMSVTQIVADSSNVGTIKIAQGLGKQGLYDALVGFGFGTTTGIGHPAESTGLLPPLDRWTNPDLAASAIGTHQSATALQLWGAYNVIANGGRYVQPRLVDSVIAPDGTRTRVASDPPRQVISPGAAAAVSGMLEEVVREGTGKALDLPGYAVAAKTGTSRMVSPEKVDPKDAYMWMDGRYHYVAAFTGFLPADRPQVSITVLIEDSNAGLTGATAAGPVFGELAQLSIRELGITPSGSTVTDPAGTPAPTGRVRAAPAAAVAAATTSDADEPESSEDEQ
jgi:cell division protein FtsI (penicillin-binding protein 3)